MDAIELGWASNAAVEPDGDNENTCAFEISANDWEERHGMPPAGGGDYDCDAEPLEQSSLCRYHASREVLEAHGETETSVFTELLKTDETDPDIVGARFERVSLSGADPELDPHAEYTLLSPRIDQFACEDATIRANLKFRRAILDDVTFDECTVESAISLFECQLTGELQIIDSNWTGRLAVTGSRFSGPVTVVDATFEAGIDFSDVRLQDDLIVQQCDVAAGFVLNPLPAVTSIFITDSTVEGLDLNVTADETTLVCLQGSDLRGGYLRQPYEYQPQDSERSTTTPTESPGSQADETSSVPDILFDLREATLDETSIQTNEHDLDNYYFYNTDLTVFDFVGHQGILEDCHWDIHELNPDFASYSGYTPGPPSVDIDGPVAPEYPNPAKLRNHKETYIPATRGAELQGDNISASRFFTRESRARKLINRRQILFPNPRRETSRIGYTIRYLKYWLLQYTCNYGESPGRTVGWSLLVIGGATVLYPHFGVQQSPAISYGATNATLGTTLGESLYFSTVTFTTLGYGEHLPAAGPSQAIAAVEAFLGSLLIALFIFTLGRTIKR